MLKLLFLTAIIMAGHAQATSLPIVSDNNDGTMTVSYQVDTGSLYKYYNFSGYEDVNYSTPVTGTFSVTLANGYSASDNLHKVVVSYQNLSQYPGSFQTNSQTLLVSKEALISGQINIGLSGEYGEPPNQPYGNGQFLYGEQSQPMVCVECGYHLTLNLLYIDIRDFGSVLLTTTNQTDSNSQLLSYSESNPYGAAESLSLVINEVPVPSAAWLMLSAISGLAIAKKRNTPKH